MRHWLFHHQLAPLLLANKSILCNGQRTYWKIYNPQGCLPGLAGMSASRGHSGCRARRWSSATLHCLRTLPTKQGAGSLCAPSRYVVMQTRLPNTAMLMCGVQRLALQGQALFGIKRFYFLTALCGVHRCTRRIWIMRQSWVKPSLSLPSTFNRSVSSEAANHLSKNGLREAAPIKIFRYGDFACLSLGSAMKCSCVWVYGCCIYFRYIQKHGQVHKVLADVTVGLCCNSILEFQLARTQTAAPIRWSCIMLYRQKPEQLHTDTKKLHGCRGQMISFLEIMTASAGLHLRSLATRPWVTLMQRVGYCCKAACLFHSGKHGESNWQRRA